jgi:hypothetical protein
LVAVSAPLEPPRRLPGRAGDLLAQADQVADDFLDELMPSSLDWRHLVRKYPRTSVALAAAAGFWVARRKGDLVLTALGSYLAAEVGSAVGVLGDLAGERRD